MTFRRPKPRLKHRTLKTQASPSKLRDLRTKVAQLEAAATDTDGKNAKLTQTLTVIANLLEVQKAENTSLGKQVAGLNAKAAQLEAAVTNAAEKNARLTQDLSSTTRQLDQQKTENATRTDQVAGLDAKTATA